MTEAASALPRHGQHRLDTRAVLCLVVCSVLWGLNPVAAKPALGKIRPVQQAALRAIGGAGLLWAWARWRGVPQFARDGTLAGGLLAGLLFAAEFACVFIEL